MNPSDFPRLYPETIQETIIRVAGEKGLNGNRLATMAGLGATTVYRYLRGQVDVTGATLDRLLRVLHLEIIETPLSKRRKGKRDNPQTP